MKLLSEDQPNGWLKIRVYSDPSCHACTGRSSIPTNSGKKLGQGVCRVSQNAPVVVVSS